MHSQADFTQLAEASINNRQQRDRIAETNHAFKTQFNLAKEQYTNIELAKERAAYYKSKVLDIAENTEIGTRAKNELP